MDVLDGGVDHAAGAARLGVERRLEEGPEDGGGDLAPVEARRAEQQLANLLRQRRYVVTAPNPEQPAVGVGEGGEFRLQVGVALGDGRVEDAEEREEVAAQAVRVARLDEAAEAVLGEDAGVLGVEAEDEPDAEPVQRGERVGRELRFIRSLR